VTTLRPPLRRDTQQTRDRLLDVTGELLTELGPTFGLPELARRGDVATATVYRHFETIHDAFDEFYLRLIDDLVRQLSEVPAHKDARRQFATVCRKWVDRAAEWGPAAVHIRSWQGFLRRAHEGDGPTSTILATLAPVVSALIEQGVLPAQDLDYAVLIWITLFDERVIIDLRTSKAWSNRRLAETLGASVLAALGSA
jgi:AcrR family transcriptional regulator